MPRSSHVAGAPDPSRPSRPVAEPSPPVAEPRRVLILGGARSGKSAAAERRLAATPVVTYVATPVHDEADAEWAQRVRTHRERRPESWRTVETTDLCAVLSDPPGGAPLLVDCLTLWLSTVMDQVGMWAGRPAADAALDTLVSALVEAWRASPAYVIAVSNEVGSGVVPPTPAGRRFRDELGQLNTRIAAESDEVWLVTAGIPLRLR